MKTEIQKTYQREWARKNYPKYKDRIHARKIKYRAIRRELINRAKSRPCQDCRIQYNPWIMQFDHRDPSLKAFGIGAQSDGSIARFETEIAKCDIVCANCHMERTHQRKKNGQTY